MTRLILPSVYPLFSVLCVAASLASCASSGRVPEPVQPDRAAPRDVIGEAIAAQPENNPPALPAFSREDFLERPPGDLESLLGAPALTRREGLGEFRRYDTRTCRIFAVVFPDAGGRPVIKSLSVGPIVAGTSAPAFASCFVTGS